VEKRGGDRGGRGLKRTDWIHEIDIEIHLARRTSFRKGKALATTEKERKARRTSPALAGEERNPGLLKMAQKGTAPVQQNKGTHDGRSKYCSEVKPFKPNPERESQGQGKKPERFVGSEGKKIGQKCVF